MSGALTCRGAQSQNHMLACSVSRQRRPGVGTRTLSVPTGPKSPQEISPAPRAGAERASGQVP